MQEKKKKKLRLTIYKTDMPNIVPDGIPKLF